MVPALVLGVGAWWYYHPGRYFTIGELTVSSTAKKYGLSNAVLDPVVWWNLHRLCVTVLDPLRESLGTPLTVTSGYRSPAVNKKLAETDPDVATKSHHMQGKAVDVEADGYTNAELYDRVRDLGLPVDELIAEADGHLHISIP